MSIHKICHCPAGAKTFKWILLFALAGAAVAFIHAEMRPPLPQTAQEPLIDLREELSVADIERSFVYGDEIPFEPIVISTIPTEADLLLENPPALKEENTEPKEKRLDYHVNSQYVNSRTVRAVNITAGMSYKVNNKSKIGIEASQEVHDPQDAKAWGKSHEDSSEARIKYFLSF